MMTCSVTSLHERKKKKKEAASPSPLSDLYHFFSYQRFHFAFVVFFIYFTGPGKVN